MTLVSLIGSITTVTTVLGACAFVRVRGGLLDFCFGGAEVIWMNVAGGAVGEGDAVPVGGLGLAGNGHGLVEGEGGQLRCGG